MSTPPLAGHSTHYARQESHKLSTPTDYVDPSGPTVIKTQSAAVEKGGSLLRRRYVKAAIDHCTPYVQEREPTPEY